MTWKILYSKSAFAFYGAGVWGWWIANEPPNPNVSTIPKYFFALFGGFILAWTPRSWRSVVLIPLGYAIGMLVVAVGPWGKLDITFAQSLLYILLTFIGSAAGNLIIHRRQHGHWASWSSLFTPPR